MRPFQIVDAMTKFEHVVSRAVNRVHFRCMLLQAFTKVGPAALPVEARRRSRSKRVPSDSNGPGLEPAALVRGRRKAPASATHLGLSATPSGVVCLYQVQWVTEDSVLIVSASGIGSCFWLAAPCTLRAHCFASRLGLRPRRIKRDANRASSNVTRTVVCPGLKASFGRGRLSNA